MVSVTICGRAQGLLQFQQWNRMRVYHETDSGALAQRSIADEDSRGGRKPESDSGCCKAGNSDDIASCKRNIINDESLGPLN